MHGNLEVLVNRESVDSLDPYNSALATEGGSDDVIHSKTKRLKIAIICMIGRSLGFLRSGYWVMHRLSADFCDKRTPS